MITVTPDASSLQPTRPGSLRFSLTSPMEIGPQGLAAVHVDPSSTGAWVACDLTSTGPQDNTWRTVVIGHQADGPDRVLYDETQVMRLRARSLARQARDVLAVACTFLVADADSYRQSMGRQTPADGWLHNAETAEWAYLNATELERLGTILAGAA